MASKAATLGDPRRPAEIRKYVRNTAAEEKPHMLGLLTMLLAMASMAIKVKVFGWAALFVAIASLLHIPTSHPDFKQTLSFTMVAVVGLGSTYFMPMPVRAPPAAAAAPPPAAAG